MNRPPGRPLATAGNAIPFRVHTVFHVKLENFTMSDGKAELYDRLRAAGQWPEASAWKLAKIKELHAEGMTRAEAKQAAWELLAEKYPPKPATEQSPPKSWEMLAKRFVHYVLLNISVWQEKHAITLTAAARASLISRVGYLVAFAWWLGVTEWFNLNDEDDNNSDALMELIIGACEAASEAAENQPAPAPASGGGASV
jgi:hypothetical protein